MPLYVVATPIGHPKDITVRALEVLQKCEVIIGEEERELSKFIKMNRLDPNETHLLNEHTNQKDIVALASLCRDQSVALISDCGTPGFCDPGAELVNLARKENIPVTSLPGPSSLATALSLSGMRLDSFLFVGFLPQKTEERQKALIQVAKEPKAQILMDTPYRLEKLATELSVLMPNRYAFLGLDLTQSTEKALFGKLSELVIKVKDQKAEFVLILSPLTQKYT
ncbi:MAG: 16S rRNA (cytidine(1402)-2'-O)-methyltransferase [Pseudomonadota bacterium]|nr:16S rRNA (cytidine(1402)-2'-O)-methyltransferase [Pseudomonadota bacterium]